MADEKKKNPNQNHVTVEGWLKENTLEQKVSNGINVISGVVTVALNDKEDYRMRFYAAEYSKNDTARQNPSKNYKNLLEMLPAKTTSIATLVKSWPEAKFDDLKGQASTVIMSGGFDLYDRKDEAGNLISSVSLRGMYFGPAGKTKGFNPRAEFTVDGSLDAIKPETDKEGNETGRYIARVLLVDEYNKVTLPINFVVAKASAITALSEWERGNFGAMKGLLHSTSEVIVEEDSDEDAWSDGTKDVKTTTKFINERIVEAVRAPYREGHDYYIAPDVIKGFAVNREDILSKLPNGDKKDDKPSTPVTAAAKAEVPSQAAQNPFKNFTL